MSENPFEFISEDARTGVAQRIEEQKRLQYGARRMRRRLRLTFNLLAVCGIGLVFAALHYEINWLGTVGLLCLFLSVPVFIALFFYGGWMPDTIRYFLSDRQKRLLDD